MRIKTEPAMKLRPGDRAIHIEFGPCRIEKICRSTGAVHVCVEADGTRGTVSPLSLKRIRRTENGQAPGP